MYRPGLSVDPSVFLLSNIREQIVLSDFQEICYFISLQFLNKRFVKMAQWQSCSTRTRTLIYACNKGVARIFTKQYTMRIYQTHIYCFAPECFGPNWSSSGEMVNWGRTFSLYPWPKAKFGIEFPVMPIGLTSSSKIVAVNVNLDIYVRIFRICCPSFVKFGIRYERVWVCEHQYRNGCALLTVAYL
jgi:hypothetical protein